MLKSFCILRDSIFLSVQIFFDRVATNLENSGNLKNCRNLRENSGKFEFLLKKPGKLRESEKYGT